MRLIKTATILLVLLFMLVSSISLALAEDDELMIGQYGGGDPEGFLNPSYDFNLYAKEVAANPGLIGSVGGSGQQGIVVTPLQYETTVTAGKLATEKFRITNLGQSDVRVSVTIQPSTDRKILDKTTLNGQREIQNLVIQAASYSTNYRDIEVAVNTDFAVNLEGTDFYTVDILVDGPNVLKKVHSFTVNVQPPVKVSPFSVLGLSVLDIPGREEACVNDTITGEVICKSTGFLSNGISLSVGMLLLLLFVTAVVVTFIARRRRRDIVPVLDSLGDPVDTYDSGDDLYVDEDADESDEEDDGGYRF